MKNTIIRDMRDRNVEKRWFVLWLKHHVNLLDELKHLNTGSKVLIYLASIWPGEHAEEVVL